MKTAAQKRLLGFDAREDAEDCKRTPIPIEVREELLLRPEVECPFSVDRHIWPSHFLYYPQIRHLMRQTQPSLIETDEECRGGLWLDLQRMLNRLSENRRHAVAIAVEVFAPDRASLIEFPSLLIFAETEPGTAPDGSKLLGFDVAPSGMGPSGLSNCGYTAEERSSLRPRWKDRINDLGLLEAEEDAFEFRDVADKRVPDAAPFWVYGLHSVPVT